MKWFALLMVAAVSLSFSFALAADEKAPAGHGELLHHVVLLKFKEGADTAQVNKALQTFAELKEKIPTIVSLKWGANVSPEHLNRGFTHAFTLTFKTEKDRNDYLVDPAHKNLGKVLGPVMDQVLVIDFWEQK